MMTDVGHPQAFAAWLAGLTLAVAFQLVLATLGVAVGLSALSFRRSESGQSAPGNSATDDAEGRSLPIGGLTGLGILTSLASVLFAACWLAVRLSGIVDGGSGAILGAWIWATYWLLLSWVSSQVAGSAIASVFGAATFGFDKLVRAARSLGGSSETEANSGLGAEEARQIARREVSEALAALDPQNIWTEQLDRWRSPPPDAERLTAALRETLVQLDGEGARDLREAVDRQTFVEMLRDRADLSRRDVEALADRLLQTWTEVMEQHAPRDWLEELRQVVAQAQPERVEVELDGWNVRAESANGSAWRSLASQIDTEQVAKALLARVDLSEWDVARLWTKLQQMWPEGTGEALGVAAAKSDIEVFAEQVDWDEPEIWEEAFREVIRDREANPALMAAQLEALSPSHLRQCLQPLTALSDTQKEAIAKRLEAIRQEELAQVQAEAKRQQLEAARSQLERAFARADDPADITPVLTATAALDPTIETAVLHCDRRDWEAIAHCQDSAEPCDELAAKLHAAGEAWARSRQESRQELFEKLENYLHYTQPERFTTGGIARKVEALAAEYDLSALHPRWTEAERQRCDRVLAKRRGNLDRDRILADLAQAWQRYGQPSEIPAPLRDCSDDDPAAIVTSYLQDLDLDRLSLEDLKSDLIAALDRPGISPLKQRLANLDWTTLVERVQHDCGWDDLSAGHITSTVADAISRATRRPRRWLARRSAAHPLDVPKPNPARLTTAATEFVSATRDRLHAALDAAPSDLSMSELSLPDIAPNWQAWLDAPLEHLSDAASTLGDTLPDDPLQAARDRLEALSRDALSATLQARDDLSSSVVDRALDQWDATRDRLLHQLDTVQQSARDRVATLDRAARDRVDAARRAAATAAWWMLATALSSAIASASAGAIAVNGWPHISLAPLFNALTTLPFPPLPGS